MIEFEPGNVSVLAMAPELGGRVAMISPSDRDDIAIPRIKLEKGQYPGVAARHLLGILTGDHESQVQPSSRLDVPIVLPSIKVALFEYSVEGKPPEDHEVVINGFSQVVHWMGLGMARSMVKDTFSRTLFERRWLAAENEHEPPTS